MLGRGAEAWRADPLEASRDFHRVMIAALRSGDLQYRFIRLRSRGGA